MKKRNKKYKPKPVLPNPMEWLRQGMVPVSQRKGIMLDLRLKNHMALTNLVQGKADRGDLDFIISALNVAEALCLLEVGSEYTQEIKNASRAVLSVSRRGLKSGRFVLTGEEMKNINLGMEIHDAQLDIALTSEFEEAVNVVREVIRRREATVINA